MKRLVVIALVACGHRAARAPVATDHFGGTLVPRAADGDEVVATVDGVPIHASAVSQMAAAEQLAPKDALDRLIDLQVTAAEAMRRGLADVPDVAEARRRESVRRFTEDEFLAKFTPAQIPNDLLEKAYATDKVHYYFDHERYQNVAFVRVTLDKKAPPDAVERARAQAEQVRALIVADKPADQNAFLASGEKHLKELGAPYEKATYAATRHSNAVEEFAAAAFTLKNHGDLTQPTRTPWGWDLIYLESVLPERHTPKDQAFEEMRTFPYLVELGRQMAFERWADALVGAHTTWKDESWLPRLSVDAPVE